MELPRAAKRLKQGHKRPKSNVEDRRNESPGRCQTHHRESHGLETAAGGAFARAQAADRGGLTSTGAGTRRRLPMDAFSASIPMPTPSGSSIGVSSWRAGRRAAGPRPQRHETAPAHSPPAAQMKRRSSRLSMAKGPLKRSAGILFNSRDHSII